MRGFCWNLVMVYLFEKFVFCIEWFFVCNWIYSIFFFFIFMEIEENVY